MKFKDVVSLLNASGFKLDRVHGSHYMFSYPKSTQKISIFHNTKNKEFGPIMVKKIQKKIKNILEDAVKKE